MGQVIKNGGSARIIMFLDEGINWPYISSERVICQR